MNRRSLLAAMAVLPFLKLPAFANPTGNAGNILKIKIMIGEVLKDYLYEPNTTLVRRQIMDTITSYTKKFDCCLSHRTVIYNYDEGNDLHGFHAVTFPNGEDVMFMFEVSLGKIIVETKHLR